MRFFDMPAIPIPPPFSPTYHQSVRLVFNTTELLELILLELDLQTLLLSQAVNHMFHSTILASVRLRQKLWFDPDPTLTAETATAGITPAPSEPLLNPLLQAIVTKGSHSHIRFLELEHSSLDFYPALSRRLKPCEPPTVCIAIAPKARVAQLVGSWRKMLVVQPYDLSTRWDAYHYRWATREWDFRFTGTFDDVSPTGGRVVRFALGPGWEAGRDE